MKTTSFRALLAFVLGSLLVAGCAGTGIYLGGDGRYGHPPERDRKPGKEGKRRADDGRGSYFHEHGYTRLRIPPGHYPPPGGCRIWYPDRPPGQQPPPGRCSPVPPGAWVLRHPSDVPGRVHVEVYEPQRPNTIRVVGEFEIATGVFVRVVMGN